MRKLISQILKFVIIGGIAFIIDYGVLFFLTEYCNIYYLLSAAFAFIISTIFNYVFSVKWVFNTKNNLTKRKKLRLFVTLSIIGLVINQLVMWFLVEKLMLYYMVSKILATFIVMIWNFLTRKKVLD